MRGYRLYWRASNRSPRDGRPEGAPAIYYASFAG
jgi:hypothetical protein